MLRRVLRPWRRSVLLRVVTTTLALSAVVVVLVGVTLLNRVADGLLTSKQRAALGEVEAGRATAQTQLTQADRTDTASLEQLLQTLAGTVIARGGSAGLYDVALLPSGSGTSYFSPSIRDYAPPPELRRQVAGVDGQRSLAYTYVTATLPGSDQAPPRRSQVLVVGAPLTAPGDAGYELYYVFPLIAETQTLALLQRLLILGGLAVVVLLAAIAGLVTRQVVRPVRLVADSAGRLAAGQREQRVVVRGEDDLARLAGAYNAMAGSIASQLGELEDLSLLQQRFTSDVSHELRTPLTTIRMAADLLHEGREELPESSARATELLVAELDRFEVLLADLLEISRYDAHAAVLEPEPTDLVALVHRVVDDHQALADRRSTTIDTAGVPQQAVMAEVDPRRVRRILANLLSNAIDHSESRPVQVSVRARGDAVAVRVRDFGVGFPAEVADLVFDRFWRADPARTRQTGGTGLGLSIAREDALLHHGRLEAWGESGQGAAFRLLLPLRAAGPITASPLPLHDDERLEPATEPPRSAPQQLALSSPPAGKL